MLTNDGYKLRLEYVLLNEIQTAIPLQVTEFWLHVMLEAKKFADQILSEANKPHIFSVKSLGNNASQTLNVDTYYFILRNVYFLPSH